MKIYGAILSPFVRKVMVVARLKGLQFEHETVIPGATPPGFDKISPLGKIPALVDGEVMLADSSVICDYLEEQYPQVPALPASAALRAKSRWLEEFADSKLSEVFGGIFFERIGKPMMMKLPPDEARVANIIAKLMPPVLDYLETQVPAQGFIFGDLLPHGIGTADISLACPIINGGYAKAFIDAARWPKTAAYIERVKAHPLVAAALAEEAVLMQAMAPQ